ncbi:Mitoferrin-2 Mitochondrial iron transporter 2 Solute carrier family 25 member 28 [Larimichthys crocea]|uniref:Mitoferrin-2 Mitochondrial iron transporter 2 Solute carrier family 25 member 28 n=1 Tax=Larimichthys crocea TaxID=215358 RepID=A0A6G0JAF1_LARCR|nr:mitoferrin-2 [Larimichthys crocea]KAE8300574.1 Mitoferrin-2 Mitochondrial iron transporter 2 Solute carrier family 25 member 28 [Larimichthys crocea]
MEADGLSRRASMETPGVDSRVTGAPGGAGFRWLDGRVLDVTGGFVGSLSPRMTGGHDFAPVLHRATPEPSTSVEPEIDYEGLPQGAATSTHMLAGSVAGIMEHCLMYPIDCVKTRMQSLHPEPGARYRNVMDALQQIVRTEGVWRPIRGVNVLAVGAGPAHALYFACYEKIKFSLSDAIHPGANSHFANGVAGCMATVLHDAIMNPAEVVKQRMQMFNSPYRGVLDCMASMLRHEGPAAFYRSYTTQLTMNVPFQALHFMTYEYLQELLNPHRQYNPSSHVVSGALAGALAAAATTPLDVCKTLLNTQEAQAIHVIQANAATAAGAVGAATASAPGSRHISGLGNAFRTVYRMGGMPAFFKGVQARVIYQMPSTAISWSVYEFFKYIITKRQHEKRLRDRDGDK